MWCMIYADTNLWGGLSLAICILISGLIYNRSRLFYNDQRETSCNVLDWGLKGRYIGQSYDDTGKCQSLYEYSPWMTVQYFIEQDLANRYINSFNPLVTANITLDSDKDELKARYEIISLLNKDPINSTLSCYYQTDDVINPYLEKKEKNTVALYFTIVFGATWLAIILLPLLLYPCIDFKGDPPGYSESVTKQVTVVPI